ncbi:MAG: hypothetical protein AAF607_06135 [Pseudomonadota bacterium]
MAKTVDDSVFDAGLNVIAGATTLHFCSGAPSNFAAVSGLSLASVAVDAGDFSIANGDTSGRKVTVASQSGVSVSGSGTVNHAALVTGSALLLVTEIGAQAVTSGNTIASNAFDFELRDPT